jgi:hypothetical protein
MNRSWKFAIIMCSVPCLFSAFTRLCFSFKTLLSSHTRQNWGAKSVNLKLE